MLICRKLCNYLKEYSKREILWLENLLLVLQSVYSFIVN